MTIRARFALWFAAVLFISLAAMGALSYYEMVIEPRGHAAGKGYFESENPVSEVIEFLAWCGVLPLALALGGGWWLMRKGLAPVTALTQAAEDLNEHNLNRRLPRTGNGDELDRLTEVLNAMTARLNESFVRIREFTLHASHELKTPLTVIHAELETALQDSALSVSRREQLESQMDEIQRLTKIVDALTLLTRADAGQIILARHPVRLDELLREAQADAQSLARPHAIDIILADCEELTVIGDRHRLRQLLLNLTDNAIKYNRVKGTVTLSMRKVAGNAQVVLTNTGQGIPPEILPRVFERFYRGDPSHNKQVEGCGLGLSIAKWIVEAHDGTVHIVSEPGKSTSVTLNLPLAPAT